jgi:hypothetical protein
MNYLKDTRAEIAKKIVEKVALRNRSFSNIDLSSTIDENLINNSINLNKSLNLVALKHNIVMNMSNETMVNNTLPMNKEGEQIIPINIDNIKSWFSYFESVTQNELEIDKKRLLLKLVGTNNVLGNFYLDNYNNSYNIIKDNLLAFKVTSSKFFPVDLKINLENKNVSEHIKEVYNSFCGRKDLPLELTKALLPDKVKRFVLNHEVNDITRLAELCQMANEQFKVSHCKRCGKAGHTVDNCWSKNRPNFYNRNSSFRNRFSSNNNNNSYKNNFKHSHNNNNNNNYNKDKNRRINKLIQVNKYNKLNNNKLKAR